MPRDATPRPPLDAEKLQALALHYVGRYATTRARLTTYLVRKLRERGFAEGATADIAGLVARLSELGYIDDQAFAAARAGSLTRRGYGERRVAQALHAAGVSDEDGAPARETAAEGALAAALALARRRRIGPFATVAAEPDAIRRAIGTLVRAGHGFDLARRIASAPPGASIEED